MTESEINEYLVQATEMEYDQLKELLVLGKMKTIKKKQLLAEPGMLIEHSYFLINGIVRHFVLGPNGEEFTKHLLKNPAFVVASIPDFFLRTSDSIHCEAVSDIEVVEWTYDELMNFAMKYPKFFHFLLKCVVELYRQKEQKEIGMHFLDAKGRYDKFMQDYAEIAYQIPLRYVASFLNIRPETLSRIRAQK